MGILLKVIHIEDEPKAIYLKLLEKDFIQVKQILILDKSDKNITIAADGEEFVLGSLVASKVSVEVLDEKEFKNEKIRTLD